MTLRSALLPLISALLLVSPVSAPAAGSGYYRATFAAPLTRSQIVARDLLWSCSGDTCTASTSNSRPAIVCSTLAKGVGRLTAFSAEGVAFDTVALEKCNANAS